MDYLTEQKRGLADIALMRASAAAQWCKAGMFAAIGLSFVALGVVLAGAL